MSRDREAGAESPGNSLPARTKPLAPPRMGPPGRLLPWLLTACAAATSLLATDAGWGAAPLVLAVLLLALAAGALGALLMRERLLQRSAEARQQQQLGLQLLDGWCWQTDAEHRLVRLAPPMGAPASSWIEGAFSGQPLWQRFDDEQRSLQQRLQLQAPIAALRVQDPSGRSWRLRGLPRSDADGRFAGYLGVARPAAEDDALAESRDALEALWQDGPLALAQARPHPDSGWCLQRANPAACRLLGLDRPPDGAQPWGQALAALPDGLRQAVLALQPGQSCTHEGRRALLVATGGRGAPDAQGSPGGLLLALAGAEDDASALHALAAEHAAFSYTVSHDLRAPIRVVDGFARILKEDYGPQLDRIGNDHIDRLLGAAARMNGMIDALLALSQLSTQALSRQPVDLSQMAGWVVDDLRRTAPQRSVGVRIAPGLQAEGDPTLLRLVLENLLGNAWKYSAKVAQPEIVFERVAVSGGRQAFLVRDNGAGFDMRFADRLFGLFQRLHGHSDFPGTGVGLASVQRIVRRHGGEIWAEGEVGQGARFYFTLG